MRRDNAPVVSSPLSPAGTIARASLPPSPRRQSLHRAPTSDSIPLPKLGRFHPSVYEPPSRSPQPALASPFRRPPSSPPVSSRGPRSPGSSPKPHGSGASISLVAGVPSPSSSYNTAGASLTVPAHHRASSHERQMQQYRMNLKNSMRHALHGTVPDSGPDASLLSTGLPRSPPPYIISSISHSSSTTPTISQGSSRNTPNAPILQPHGSPGTGPATPLALDQEGLLAAAGANLHISGASKSHVHAPGNASSLAYSSHARRSSGSGEGTGTGLGTQTTAAKPVHDYLTAGARLAAMTRSSPSGASGTGTGTVTGTGSGPGTSKPASPLSAGLDATPPGGRSPSAIVEWELRRRAGPGSPRSPRF